MPLNKIEQIFAERKEALAVIAPYISIHQREKLQAKIAGEKEKLSRLLAPKRISYSLNENFFVRKSLNTNIFE